MAVVRLCSVAAGLLLVAGAAACHDSHGSRQNAHLINFMTRDINGKAVVSPNRTGRIDFIPNGVGKGTCYLTCHGLEHNPLSY